MKLILKHPVSPLTINQPFDGNSAYYQANGIKITGHNGIDFQAKHGQPVFAAHDGVIYYETDSKQGHGAVLLTSQPFDYKDYQAFYKTIYWHLCDPKKESQYAYPFKDGDSVKTGQVIGYADSTGLSTGDHLHFGLKPIKPGTNVSYKDAPDMGIGQWVNIEQDNGYLGAINPITYLNNVLFTRELTVGSRGDDVKLLQKTLGMSVDNQTGYFGQITRANVMWFQMKNGITPFSGYVGIKTLAKLNGAV